MAISQPASGDKLNSPDHSLMHRQIATDPAATTESFVIDASGHASGVAVGTGAYQLIALDSAAKLPAVDGSQLTGVGGGARVAIYATAGSTQWTSPVAVTTVYLTMIGGGGGGGSGNANRGGGGAGGNALIKYAVTITGTTAYDIVIGTGGGSNAAGSNTTFNTTIVASGGNPGASDSLTGGANNVTTLGLKFNAADGNGAGTIWGIGGTGTSGSYVNGGDAPSGYGSGGGGAGDHAAGGSGRQGACVIEW